METAFIPISLGCPDKFDELTVRRFLQEFLGDPFVMTLPTIPRKLLAKFIASRRWKHYADNLKKISINGKAPVRYYAENIFEALKNSMPNSIIEPAFRYPNLKNSVEDARKRGADRFCFFTFSPQNSHSITQSAKFAASAEIKSKETFLFKESYCDNPLYISALLDSLRPALDSNADVILTCFHSVPLKQLKNSPYEAECKKTAKILEEKTGVKTEIAWQSKMGFSKWLEPSVEEKLTEMKKRGVKKICAICPGFFCDCTETLLEINQDARIFAEKLDMEFEYTQCLNDTPSQIKLFKNILEEMQ